MVTTLTNPVLQGEVIAATLQNMSNEIIDNISKNNALFDKLKQRGNFKAQDGGLTFRVKPLYAENSNTAWGNGYDTFATNPQDVLTYADYDPKVITSSIPFFDKDISQNNGKEQLVSIAKAGMQSTIISLVNNVGDSLFSDGTDTDQLEGLQLLISKTPDVGVIAGIDRASYEFWRNQYYSFSENSIIPSSSTIVSAMTALYMQCMVQGQSDVPDLIICDQIYWEYYNASQINIQRTNQAQVGEAGFESLKFRRADVVYDPNCPASTMYMINTKYFSLQYLGVKNSSNTPGGSMNGGNKKLPPIFTACPATRPVNQLVNIHPVMGLMNLVVENFRTSGVLYN